MDWDIKPEGVGAVLNDVQGIAQGFDPLVKAYSDGLKAMMEGLQASGSVVAVVGNAVGEFAEHWAPALESAAKQIGASINGASDATKAYLAGQQEMAANAQRRAAEGKLSPELEAQAAAQAAAQASAQAATDAKTAGQ